MLNFVHDIPTRYYFGEGQISNLAGELSRFGKNVLLTYGGGSVKRSGLYDTIMDILNGHDFKVTELNGIDPNPRITSVREGVRLCKENGVDVILAVGGGSTIDCSKAIACGFYWEGDDLWDMIRNPGRNMKALPLVDILTLSATGSEFDPFGVISNMETNEKFGVPLCYPSVSICDPTYTFSVPAYHTAAGSADIMSHIIEGYFSRTDDSDLADGMCETILKSVMKNCPVALKDPSNYSARANLMHNSSIACSHITEYGKQGTMWPCHGMEHELSAFYDITHGVGLAILTPRWMRFILAKDPTVTGRFARFARNVIGLEGNDDAALAKEGIDALEAYFASTGIPMKLSELGIGEEHFSEMADHANKINHLELAYVPLTNEDIVEIFRASL